METGLLESYLDDTWQERKHTEDSLGNTDSHLVHKPCTEKSVEIRRSNKEWTDQLMRYRRTTDMM